MSAVVDVYSHLETTSAVWVEQKPPQMSAQTLLQNQGCFIEITAVSINFEANLENANQNKRFT